MIKYYLKNRSAFTIIELLIVIMIIGILVGVAVPYYNDYIIDSRLSVLKQNLATMRNAINQFRGDRGRGPFRVEVQGGPTDHEPWSSDKTTGSELVAGAFLSDKTRQSNINYLPSLPTLPNPEDGQNLISTITPTGSATVCFIDSDTNDIFNIDNEFAFFDIDYNEEYASNTDIPLYNSGPDPVTTLNVKPLDYISFEVSANGVTY